MNHLDQFGVINSGMDFTGALPQWSDPAAQHASMNGFMAVRRNAGIIHERRVNQASRLYADCLTGRLDPIFIREAMRPSIPAIVAELNARYPGIYGDPGGRHFGLRETMSVTDYQALFVDVLDRIYYGYYSAYPIVNLPLVRNHDLRDFRLVSRYLADGVVSPLTSMDAAAPPPQRALTGPVPQGGNSPLTASTAALQYQPLLYQAMTSVNWRAMVNDDLGIFRDLAQRLAIAGNRGISKFISTFYMDSAGPNALLYTSGYGNIVNQTNGASSNNPALNAQGVSDAFKILAGMKDSGGDPILMQGKAYLWYGPAWVAAAQNLKRALNMYLTQEGGVAGTAQPGMFVNVENWLMQDLELVMDPYIPIISTSKPKSWGIIIDPNTMNRPAIEVGWLQGYKQPQLMQKVPNTQRMGGGVDPTLGDFYTMDSDMKIVTVMGGKQIDGRSTVASDGSGT